MSNAPSRSSVLSNATFLLPAGIAVEIGLNAHSLFILAAALTSAAYHADAHGRGLWLDKSAAWALVVSNTSLIAAVGLANPFALCAVALLPPALFVFYVVGKDDWEWHTLCAGITCFCLLTHTSVL